MLGSHGQEMHDRQGNLIVTMRGAQPFWPDNLMKRHIRPVARANGIHKQVGWHTFRHTYGKPAQGERGRCEDGTGALETREQQDHA